MWFLFRTDCGNIKVFVTDLFLQKTFVRTSIVTPTILNLYLSETSNPIVITNATNLDPQLKDSTFVLFLENKWSTNVSNELICLYNTFNLPNYKHDLCPHRYWYSQNDILVWTSLEVVTHRHKDKNYSIDLGRTAKIY